MTLNAQINSLVARTFVDSQVTEVFIHPNFVQECIAKIRPKVILREVQVINGRMINSRLITHEAMVELEEGDH